MSMGISQNSLFVGACLCLTPSLTFGQSRAKAQDSRSEIETKQFVYGVLFTPDGESIMSAHGNQTVRCWNIATGKELKGINYSRPVSAMRLTPKGDRLILQSSGISVQDFKSGKEVQWFPGYVHHFVLSGNGEDIITFDLHFNARLRNIRTEKSVRVFRDLQVRGATSSPDGQLTALRIANDPDVVLWNMDTNKEAGRLSGAPAGGSALAFSPDGNLVAGGGRGSVWIWDVRTGRRLKHKLPVGEDWIRNVVFSPKGDRVLADCGGRALKSIEGSTSSVLYLLELQSGKVLGKYVGSIFGARGCAIHPNGKLALFGDQSRIVLLRLP